jgi:hypothetical protein
MQRALRMKNAITEIDRDKLATTTGGITHYSGDIYQADISPKQATVKFNGKGTRLPLVSPGVYDNAQTANPSDHYRLQVLDPSDQVLLKDAGRFHHVLSRPRYTVGAQ